MAKEMMANQKMKGTWFQMFQPASDQIIGDVPRDDPAVRHH